MTNSCRLFRWLTAGALLATALTATAQAPANGPSADEMVALNNRLKSLLIEQDSGAQAILNKYPGLNLLAVPAFGGGFGGRGGPAAPPVPADQPATRTDQNSLTAHAQLLEKAKAGGIDLYFEGDSITRRWGATDYPELLANWKQNFFGWNAADFGWGADRVENILWRLDNGELDGVNPKVIVLLAGTNNLGGRGGEDANVADITRGLQAVLKVMQQKAPGATIIVTGIFPRNDNMALLSQIYKINDNLAKLADSKKIRYLNINDQLADANGRVYDGMLNTSDRLHPTLKGYEIWAAALKPVLTELLGPPAKEDHAPPPTGDPSAARGTAAPARGTVQ